MYSGGGNGGGGDGSDCVVFSAGTERPLIPSYELKNPFCGQSLFDKIATTLHLGFAFAIAVLTGLFGFASAKWIDGERMIRGGFSLMTQKVSRFKKSRLSIAVLAGLASFILGLGIGLLIPAGVQLVAFISLLLVRISFSNFSQRDFLLLPSEYFPDVLSASY